MYKNYREGVFGILKSCPLSFLVILCPFLGESTVRGAAVAVTELERPLLLFQQS